MNTVTASATDRPTTTRLSVKNHIGLVLATLLGLGDLESLISLRPSSPAQIGPPTSVLIFSAIMGLVTVVAAVVAWMRRSRVALRVTAVARILSVITALPAFFISGVAAYLVALAAGGVLLTVVTVWLLLARGRTDAGRRGA